jgi:hypothetical protein
MQESCVSERSFKVTMTNSHRRLSQLFRAAIGLIACFFVLETKVQAYTDPGSGAIIWQLLAAGFVGVLYYFRKLLTWVRLRTGIKK